MYRAALTYHPEIATPKGRGAWRVHCCFDGVATDPILYVSNAWPIARCLVMPVPRQLHPKTFANPTKLLREWFAQRKQGELHAQVERTERPE